MVEKRSEFPAREKVIYTTISPSRPSSEQRESKDESQRENWRNILLLLGFVALVIMLLALGVEVNKVADLDVQNRNLRATIQVLATQKAQLQATVQALKGVLPTPGP